MLTFTSPHVLTAPAMEPYLANITEKRLRNFFQELEQVVNKNHSDDFHDWFRERTYLSIFFNGIIRHDAHYESTVIQEYCTTHEETKAHGRCDGFLNEQDTVTLFEAKLNRYPGKVSEDHFDLAGWMNWDEKKIRTQLNEYLDCDKRFFLNEGRYKRCFLSTLVFLVIKEVPGEHINKANQLIEQSKDNLNSQQWFYSVGYFADHSDTQNEKYGIEVYGTIKEVDIEPLLTTQTSSQSIIAQ
ncbi:hypothetical protein [Paracnuella aquatica]|uniref:hypothetical protein n=1 Tax=Paracnuella aquatica TaxID=2268757 RepID=UPI000F513A89|nr:hypothetical protein [Paracnuella aquatica]RPD43566.1 hypothetical protein DRJ53_19700 [Paracnuella aquatica]